ncbi:nicotinic acetylcholine receptor alpha 9 subunit precursor [Nasonia vitripennis]|uniref:Nicotinic acetylcholine receptor subunit alpha 9 n=1 Tax=Nasonia vitripennis TaxID=7425 RepID=D3UA21_NASVI|nr:nicotinic acetylcholine receptor alpha 9 subunit precursor [Nasonia vitripennis]ACY82694.1 nicotinic acetylcholine receptor subunit alpha 9 [Nasonia vitripennis]
MRLSLVLLLLAAVGLCRAATDTCNILSAKSPTLRLKRHLFCEYDTSIRPVLSKNTAVNVSVVIRPMLMNFIDDKSTFILHAWISFEWTDQHLTWKPEDFDGVQETRVKSDEIWVPDFALYNSGDMETSQTGIPETLCQLSHTGSVICLPSIKYKTLCESDFTYWPYDKQTCTLRMGSWTHTGEEISFDFKNSSIDMSNYRENNEWKILNYTASKKNPKYSCCPNETFPSLLLDFELARHPTMLHAAYITPAVVLMVITLTVLWLDSRSVERISLAAVNFICHLLCINDLHWMVPVNGSYGSPHILLFFRDSMVLATFAMVVTTLLRKLQSTKVAPPGWIVATVTIVASNRAGRFLLLDDNNVAGDDKQLVSNNNSGSGDVEENVSVFAAKTDANESWRKLAIIIEWLAFIATAFTYIMLIILLVPSPVSWK